VADGWALRLGFVVQPQEIPLKSHREEISLEVPTRRAFVNLTPQVAAALDRSGIREGLCLVNAMHITASVFINDDESGLHADYEKWLETLAPHAPTDRYRHNLTGEDNADAHLKRQVMGREVVIAVTGGRLDFGRWEQIFYGEFDGRRRKRVLVKIVGE
jgi:secondary thiamine-phosphate synthase enzyme